MFQQQFEVISCSPVELTEFLDTPYNQHIIISKLQHDDDCDIIQSFLPMKEIWHISQFKK